MSPLEAPIADRRNSDLAAAVAEAREKYAAARPKSAALHDKARATLPGGNTRSVLFYAPFPTAMAGGDGCWVTDIDGHRYLDMLGEYTAGLFGHSEKRIVDAVKGALDRGINLAAVGENESKLAALMCGRFPSVELVRFTNSGTEANLMALALARAHTGKGTVLFMRGGYHGGVLSIGLDGPTAVTMPGPFALTDYNDIEAAGKAIRETADLAAVILEPMMGGGGCIPATREFLAALREATTAAGALLIFDEVMTSRMSFGGMQARHAITPDVTTFGKYIAGGMSFGAFGGRAEIMAAFDGHKPGSLTHSGTFNNNVLSMAAGCVAIGEIFDAEAAEALWQRGEQLRADLNAVLGRARTVMHFSGLGSMMQPHFRAAPVLRPYKPEPAEDQLRELFYFDMLAAGIYIARRGMAALTLPAG
ncbi:MAG: aminotransferase class III-fold pyridoxal phosphate-dependent enzyme, partial [Acetobacteraceae bacterium]|nr:aminotransferase class III-fold pyridoxal phosphate-dependent enzyme [Acetobacteraceae bacterium]